DPAWGRFKSKTFPAPGNHEYETAFGAPYFAYFGSRAGPSGLGYYSFTLGNWLILSLNSMTPLGAGSEQLVWVQDQLSVNRTRSFRISPYVALKLTLRSHDHDFAWFEAPTVAGAGIARHTQSGLACHYQSRDMRTRWRARRRRRTACASGFPTSGRTATPRA